MKDVLKLLGLLIPTIISSYLVSEVVSSLWYIIIIIGFFFSNSNSVWLAFLLTISDGFLGFFGNYETTLNILPGLPEIELSQIIILICFIKTFKLKKKYSLYYRPILIIFFVYVVFLILRGFSIGLTGGLNVYFRVFKLTFPLSLYYSIPYLLNSQAQFDRFFRLVFLIALSSVITQGFNIITGYNFAEYIGIKDIGRYSEYYQDKGIGYRGFYNPNTIILAVFASLYYLHFSRKIFRTNYLLIVLISCYISIYLSATRGWIISFSIVIVASLIFGKIITTKRVFNLALFLLVALILITLQPRISSQLKFANERLETMNNLIEGDYTADNSLARITERSPKVMSKWFEKPIFGWGFSQTFFDYSDGHVGTQNILLHGGIIGLIIMFSFLFFFNYKLVNVYRSTRLYNPELLLFLFFTIGWVVLHSSSGQQFSFYTYPASGLILSVFYSFGAFNYASFYNKFKNS